MYSPPTHSHFLVRAVWFVRLGHLVAAKGIFLLFGLWFTIYCVARWTVNVTHIKCYNSQFPYHKKTNVIHICSTNKGRVRQTKLVSHPPLLTTVKGYFHFSIIDSIMLETTDDELWASYAECIGLFARAKWEVKRLLRINKKGAVWCPFICPFLI